MFGVLLAILILDAIILTVAVLLQAGQGGGLAALGGGSSTDSFMGGRQAVTVLTKLSWWCGGIFLALSLILAGMSARGSRAQSVLEGQFSVPAPAAPLPLNLNENPPSGGAGNTGTTNNPGQENGQSGN